jgi:hypothetical protein
MFRLGHLVRETHSEIWGSVACDLDRYKAQGNWTRDLASNMWFWKLHLSAIRITLRSLKWWMKLLRYFDAGKCCKVLSCDGHIFVRVSNFWIETWLCGLYSFVNQQICNLISEILEFCSRHHFARSEGPFHSSISLFLAIGSMPGCTLREQALFMFT